MSRVAMGVGVLALGGAGYMMFGGESKPKEVLTAEQMKTRMLRSRVSGQHPSTVGGEDCNSRSYQAGKSLKHLDSGKLPQNSQSHEGKDENRKVVDGTVVMK